MRIIFETSDLTYASPSTISRCGVVRVTDNILSVDLLYLRWVKQSKIVPHVQSTIEKFIPLVVKPSIEFVKEKSENCIFPCQSSYLFMVRIKQCNS